MQQNKREESSPSTHILSYKEINKLAVTYISNK